jgi:hypothetical protein
MLDWEVEECLVFHGYSCLSLKVDILIKSFYRPYYLARCLSSIQQYVKGEFVVKILDDGTPARYLDKIKEDFPWVEIQKSNEYVAKVLAIEQHLKGEQNFSLSSIPVDLWREAVQNSSDHFLLLEEDAWFRQTFSLFDVKEYVEAHSIILLKLGWNNNPLLINSPCISSVGFFDEIQPAIILSNPRAVSWYFSNRFNIRSVLTRLGLGLTAFRLSYYQLYTVASAVFRKDYWLAVWDQSPTTIQEGAQLLNALRWKHESRGGGHAKTKEEVIHTSFITASYNRFKVLDFDMIRLNHALNEAWLMGRLRSDSGLPADFEVGYLKDCLEDSLDPTIVKEWDKWIDLFKSVHRDSGSVID